MLRKTPLERKKPLVRKSWLKRSEFKPRRKKADIPTSVRGRVAARSKGRCEARTPVCTGTAEHMHHKLRRSQGGKHTEANIIHIDHRCHDFIHQHPELSYSQSWLIHPWDAPS